MPIISGSLDALLGIVCLILCRASARAGNDFLAHGFAWISSAALVGGLRLGGFSEFADTHFFLTQVSKGPGMLFLSLGIFVPMTGCCPSTRWWSPMLSATGVGLVTFYLESPTLDQITLGMSLTILLALLLLAFSHVKARRSLPMLAALGSLASLLFVAFGVRQLPLTEDGLFRPVDLVHILLAIAYLLLAGSVRSLSSSRPFQNDPS